MLLVWDIDVLILLEVSIKSRLINGIHLRAIKVYIPAKIPCIHLPTKYFFIDKSVLATMLNTWRKTEKPPSPSKKAHRITFCEIAFILILEINFTPFVSSRIPETRGVAKLKSIQ